VGSHLYLFILSASLQMRLFILFQVLANIMRNSIYLPPDGKFKKQVGAKN
jgi:hypothetical protein